jgi:recombination protein RecR
VSALPEPLNNLIAELGALPGVGPRSAERLALHLVQSDARAVDRLAQSMVQARAQVHACRICGGFTAEQPCPLCQDARRDASQVCIVERPVDVVSLEKSGSFRGKYHVLGGRISPLNGVGPEDLRIAEMESRLDHEPVKEIILALGSDVESDATCFYLAKRLAARSVLVTRIAQGLPVGSGLELADELTLTRAIEGRRSVT